MRASAFTRPIGRYALAAVVSLAIVQIVLSLQAGGSAGELLDVFVSSNFGSSTSLLNLLRWFTPVLLSGLALVIGVRAGVFNIGVEGQIIWGALASTLVVRSVDLPALPLIGLSIVAGTAAGALWAYPPAWLLRRYGVNEIVTTLMLNYVAALLSTLIVRTWFIAKVDGDAGTAVTTEPIPSATELWRLTPASDANVSIFLAVALCLVVAFVLHRTRLGQDVLAVGDSPKYARYTGVDVGRVKLLTFVASGAVAGLAGSLEVLGVQHRFVQDMTLGIGYDGITVAVLGGYQAIGAIGGGLFVGALKNSVIGLSSATTASSYLISLLMAVFILGFVANPYAKLTEWIRTRRVKR